MAAIMAVALSAGCAHPPSAAARVEPAGVPAAVYIVLRHAEKADDGSHDSGPNDPGLAASGQARAVRIAETLRDARLQAVYATAYRRTQSTAAPAAAAHGLEVRTYDAGRPAETFAAELRTAHPRGTVLVVGHSNTVPAIAAALCACPVVPIAEDAYGRWIEVRIGPDGTPRLVERTY